MSDSDLLKIGLALAEGEEAKRKEKESKKEPAKTPPEKLRLPVGLLGISCETISAGKSGYCWFPIGEWDPQLQRRRWVRRKVTALEDVRELRDVVVTNEQEQVKEHTPVELSYEKSGGGYQRVGEDYPLPVTMGTKAITYKTVKATASGNTEILTPSSRKKIKVHWYSISNKHTVSVDVGMRFGSTGDIKHRYALAADGGNVTANLTDACWEGDEDETLYAYLDAAYSGGVYFNVGYSEK